LNSVYLLLQYLFQCLFSLLFLGGMIWRVVTVTREHNAIFLGTGILLIAAGIGIMWFQVRNNQKSQEKILQIRKKNDRDNGIYLYQKKSGA